MRGDQLQPVPTRNESLHSSDTESDDESAVCLIDADGNDQHQQEQEQPQGDFMARYNLSLNIDQRLIICNTCSIGLTRTKLAFHLSRYHKYPKVNMMQLSQSIPYHFEGPGENSPYVEPRAELCERIPGIQVYEGFRCKYCPFFVRQWKSVTIHHFHEHRGEDYRKEDSKCLIQKLFSGVSKYYGVLEEQGNLQEEVIDVPEDVREYLYSKLTPVCRIHTANSNMFFLS